MSGLDGVRWIDHIDAVVTGLRDFRAAPVVSNKRAAT